MSVCVAPTTCQQLVCQVFVLFWAILICIFWYLIVVDSNYLNDKWCCAFSQTLFLPSVFLLWWDVFAFIVWCHFSRVWLCHSMDCSLSGSSVHGVLQARTLEWVAMPSSRGSSWPRDQTPICLLCWQEGSLPLKPPGKPFRPLAHF